jgi:hypothetical protein
MPMSRRDADAASTPEAQPDDPSLDDDLDGVVLDRQWAREAPVHELSARGRSVQHRLQRPAEPAAKPSRWKRFRFWLFRVTRSR